MNGEILTQTRVWVIITSILIVMTAPAWAQEQTLDEVLQIVYTTNPEIRAERARQDATAEEVAQARSSVLPQISGQAGYSRTRNDQVVNSEVFGQTVSETRRFDLNPVTASVNAELPLFTGFRSMNAIAQAKSRVGAGEAQLRAIEYDVLTAAATAYFDVLRDRQIYDATLSNLNVLQEHLKQAEARFRYGEITKTDVRQAEARLAGAQSRVSAAQAQLAISRAEFRQRVGNMPGDLQPNPYMPVVPNTEADAQAYAQDWAPVIMIAEENEEASRRQIAIEKSAFSPTVSLMTSYQYSDEPSSFIDRDEQLSYGLRATVPVFNGGLRISRVKEARALNRRDQHGVAVAKRQVEVQITSAWNRLIEARLRIASSKAEVVAHQAALLGVQKEAQYGVRTTLDVLNAELELLNSKTAYSNAMRDERVASFELLRSMGALAAQR